MHRRPAVRTAPQATSRLFRTHARGLPTRLPFDYRALPIRRAADGFGDAPSYETSGNPRS